MVATRRSLSGPHASPSTSSPPTTAPPTTTTTPQLSRAQQAALKKLDIAGTDALKGDAKAAAARKAAVQTYHYRGAVYAADANTPSAWLENQPKRYLKRGRLSSAGAGDGGDGGSVVGGEEYEEEEDSPARRPAKRQRVPQKNKPAAAAAETSSRGKGRPSLPAKRKAAALRDDDEDEDDNTMPRQSAWQTSNEEERLERLERLQERATAVPSKKAPIPDANTMTSEIQRRKQDAMRQQYQVAALAENGIKSAEEVERSKLVKLAKTQRLISAKIREWKMAKELMEVMKREAELKDALLNHNGNTPQQTNYQPTLDPTGSDSEHSEHSEKDDNEEEELGEQWEREQDQTNTHSKTPPKPEEIPETSPAAPTQPSNHSPDPFTTAGASRLQTPQSAEKKQRKPATSTSTSTFLTGPNALPHPSTRGYTPTKASVSNERSEHNNHANSPNADSMAPFTSLPPTADLPTNSAGGHPLRWTIKRSVSLEAGTGKERAEYAIEVTRLEGESKSAKVRRVRRERAIVEEWARITGGVVVEEEGGRRESRDSLGGGS